MRGVRPAVWSMEAARLSIVAILMLASVALAQPVPLPGFELEQLELNPDGQGSLVVGSGQLLREGTLRLSLAGHYENDPLVMYRGDTLAGSVVRHRVTAHMLFAWAPLSWLELGAQLPVVAYQGGTEEELLPEVVAPASAGLATSSVHVRVSLLSQERRAPVDLALELGAGLPVGNDEALARDRFVRLTPRVMAGRSFGWLRAGVSAGMLLRPTTELGLGTQPVDVLGNEVRLGAMVSTQGQGLRGELNVVGDIPLTRTEGSMEILAGVRLPVREVLELYALGGPGIGDAPGTPTFRVLLGVAAGNALKNAGGPQDADGDGVLDAQDACPKEAGPAVRQGCPVPDRDKDGIEDAQDKCPDTAGVAVRQGCPVDDGDGDGIEDAQDKCPDKAGPAARQGCPVSDRDGDGVEDEQDKCPDEKGPAARQGCPVVDRDGDGIEDEQDKCPDEKGPAVRQGCPVGDRDGDGIEDAQDKCPDEKGLAVRQGCPVADKDKDGTEDEYDDCDDEPGPAVNRGCPVIKPGSTVLEIREKVNFATGKAIIEGQKSFEILNLVADVLREHPEVTKVRIEGHTDNTGNAAKNRKLSKERADAVKTYLVGKGIAAGRLETRGFGPDEPIASNETKEGRDANRRVEFIITTREREQK
jgi:outer membrane protein OmpA-like peptidoglycan-associated protein